MDWFAKHEQVCKLFNFLSKLFNQESPSRLTLKYEPVRKHFNLVNNLFNHENNPCKWIGSQSMNWFASFSFFETNSSIMKTFLLNGLVRKP